MFDPTGLSTLDDLTLMDYAINHFGGGRNHTDSDTPGEEGVYLVEAKYDEGDEEGEQTATLFFQVDWNGQALILQDATLPLTPWRPGWTDVQEWRIEREGIYLYLAKTNKGRVFIAEPGRHHNDPLEVECPACDNGTITDWQHEDDGAVQTAHPIERPCELCGGTMKVSPLVHDAYQGEAQP